MSFRSRSATHRRLLQGTLLALAASFAWCSAVRAEEVYVGVAANFILPMQRLGPDFEQKTGNRLTVAYASSGKLYAQIKSGAPFDVLLSADSETPVRLEDEGFAVPGTRFTYAFGRLVLWSPRRDLVDERGDVLKASNFRHLAIANPKLAPYGRAAVETLLHMKLLEQLEAKFVIGEDISQTHQFVASGNAELGFVALSQLMAEGRMPSGAWLVPESFYKPIKQDAVLLKRAKDSPGAETFLRYMKSTPVRAVIRSYGYNLTDTQ